MTSLNKTLYRATPACRNIVNRRSAHSQIPRSMPIVACHPAAVKSNSGSPLSLFFALVFAFVFIFVLCLCL
jgi:hypothetical protein